MSVSKEKRKFWMRFILTLILLLSTAYLMYVEFNSVRKNENLRDIGDISKMFIFETEEEWDDEELCTVVQNIEYVYYSHDDPLWEQNNKFGLYIYAEEKDFFEIAQKLVNSNGGKWGYVLIPYNVRDYDTKKWARVFDQLIKKNLIPVIQLWNVDIANYQEETRNAAEFLNRFIWPIKYRYISVYNEPNDNKFWYERSDAAEYARILDYTIRIFKEVNQDFFMMNAAFNVSASSDGQSTDSFEFMKKMDESVSGIFDKLDGWASHPYPQPNFSGSPYATGRWSIRAYEDELKFLKDELGVEKELPVFITETGWAHAEGENYEPSFPPVKKVAEYFEIAFNEVWLKDDRVRAVMPFTIRYDPPFDHFSWINKDKVPYLHYEVLKKIEKVEGKPPTLSTGNVDIYNCLE
ncbi:hypothetical protein K0B04_02270 [Patescibacteria group bacterium]|nr:hypothetical protein [Patescibacteria group bacterium]